MQARQAQLSEILNQQRTLSIPVYQRHYRWDRRQLKVLWVIMFWSTNDSSTSRVLLKSTNLRCTSPWGTIHWVRLSSRSEASPKPTTTSSTCSETLQARPSWPPGAIREAWYPLKSQAKGGSQGADPALLQLRATYNASNLVIPSEEIGGLSTPRFRPAYARSPRR